MIITTIPLSGASLDNPASCDGYWILISLQEQSWTSGGGHVKLYWGESGWVDSLSRALVCDQEAARDAEEHMAQDWGSSEVINLGDYLRAGWTWAPKTPDDPARCDVSPERER
jgi:hypothetical protein